MSQDRFQERCDQGSWYLFDAKTGKKYFHRFGPKILALLNVLGEELAEMRQTVDQLLMREPKQG